MILAEPLFVNKKDHFIPQSVNIKRIMAMVFVKYYLTKCSGHVNKGCLKRISVV